MCKGRVLSSCKALCRHLQNHSASKASQWMLDWRRGCVKRSVIASQLEEEVQQAVMFGFPIASLPSWLSSFAIHQDRDFNFPAVIMSMKFDFLFKLLKQIETNPPRLIEMNKMGSYTRFHDVQSCQYLRVQSSIGPATLCGGCSRPAATT